MCFIHICIFRPCPFYPGNQLGLISSPFGVILYMRLFFVLILKIYLLPFLKMVVMLAGLQVSGYMAVDKIFSYYSMVA